jgi:hypothetical protein
MIGWIALAGIIVRNSILLVDFSIHQIQQGTSVVESVIMACKTRTRPIMITALALVCGSSVIFFDPIFQGMAISLASGVLVSTVLTLIVIPLGCISASKDLLEVAAATAPEGAPLPQPERAAEDVGVAATEPQAETAQDDRRPSLPARLWGSVVGLVTLVFYLFRGLFLLLFQRLGRLAKRSGKSEALALHTGGTGGEEPNGAPPAPAQGGGQTARPSSMAAQSAAATAPAVKKKVVAKAKKRPATLKKQVKKKAASPQAKIETAPATTAKTKPSGGNGGLAGGRGDEVAEKRETDSNVASFPTKKRSSRRGIRLK